MAVSTQQALLEYPLKFIKSLHFFSKIIKPPSFKLLILFLLSTLPQHIILLKNSLTFFLSGIERGLQIVSRSNAAPQTTVQRKMRPSLPNESIVEVSLNIHKQFYSLALLHNNQTTKILILLFLCILPFKIIYLLSQLFKNPPKDNKFLDVSHPSKLS
jgi:hypothetical protein